MTHTFEASCCSPAFKPLGELDDEKVSTTLAEFFSSSWTKAKDGDVNAAVALQHYADRASAHGTQEDMMYRILDKMEPLASAKLRQAIITGNVISFELAAPPTAQPTLMHLCEFAASPGGNAGKVHC